jgi:hypothetical protein
VIHEYAGIITELEDRVCPHCKKPLEAWLAPPETGWGVIVVCFNNECEYYKGSGEDIINKRDASRMGCRYAENPDNNYASFNLVAVCF